MQWIGKETEQNKFQQQRITKTYSWNNPYIIRIVFVQIDI